MRKTASAVRCFQAAVCTMFALTPAFAVQRFVSAGQALQQVLNDALPGDVITLQAGATFTGNFVLPAKAGTTPIVIESSLITSLSTGRRVKPSDAPLMAKLVSPNGTAALATATGAHHYIIRGLEMTVSAGVYTMNIVQLGSGYETSTAQLPYALTFDRVYIHGDKKVGGKRGIALNSGSTTVSNSWISDINSTSQDSQAICGWNGTGPYQILNNYLEASGENVLFGGALARIPNLVPSDITIKKNHFFKRLSWKASDPSYAGTNWVVKNLFELKNARRVTMDGNIFENIWAEDQAGFALQLTVRTESGKMPWAVVEDVVFSNNIIRNADGGINMLGKDGTYGGALRRITVRNNLFDKINGHFVQLLHACNNTTVDHNTVFHKTLIVSFDGADSLGFVYRNNISAVGSYGIFGGGQQQGNVSLAAYAPGSVVTKNVIAGASSVLYPAGNYFPNSIYDARFVNTFAGNYALASDSPYRAAGTDGKDLGADFAALTTATASVVNP